MTPILKVKPGVKLGGIKPEMAIVLDVVPIVFARHGYDCWLTSAVREGDGPSKHDFGQALDFDSSTNISEEVGLKIACLAKTFLGNEFGTLWHGPYWHLHVQFPRPGV